MINSNPFLFVLEYFTIWKVLAVFLVIIILRITKKYFNVWAFLHEFKTKYGAETLFKFPIGFPLQLEADQNDAWTWNKNSIRENPKIRLLATHFGTKKMLFLIDPGLLKEYLTDQSRYKKSHLFDFICDFIGKGLLFSNGKVWKKHRKLISETFRFEFIVSQIPVICRVAKELFEKEFTKANGKNVNILEVFQLITGELVFQIFFGSDLLDAHINGVNPTKYLARFMSIIFANLMSPENVFFGASGIRMKLFKRNRELFQYEKEFTRFTIDMIEERKRRMNDKSNDDSASKRSKDFLDILLEAQKLSHGTEDEFTQEEIIHEFLTFFMAGTDTTGHLLTMATYYYSTLPNEVKEEVMRDAEYLAKNTEEITPEKLNKVDTLTAFLKETLRMGGPAPLLFEREANEDHFIGNVLIPKGTMINCSFSSNNFSPEYYKEPEKFNIYRWIPGHEDFALAITKNPFIFTPFSAGPRNCIGQHLAMMEAKIIFSIFITNFKFKIPENYKLRMRMLFLYEPRDTLYLDIENHNENAAKNSFKCI